MSVSSFLSNENVQILWEVIIDDPAVSQNTTTQQVFTRVIPEFYEREKKKFGSLMEMNKHFISIIIDLLNNGKQLQQKQEQVKGLKEKITFEELQQERVSQFEKDLNAKQQEFSSAMAIPLPPAPVFSDTQREEMAIPLTDMEKMIEQTLAERNLEMQKIQQTLSASQSSNGDSWLKGQSTSVKEQNEREKQTALNSAYVPKTIQIGKEMKEVSWGETTHIENFSPLMPIAPDRHENPSIFSKLKVKDPLKELEDLMNARFDKIEEMIISINKKE